MSWFIKTKKSKTFLHPMLGTFCYSRLRGWEGSVASNGQKISLIVAGSPAEPDAMLLKTMIALIENLDSLKEHAYSFIAQEAPDFFANEAFSLLNVNGLCELQAIYPNREWLKSGIKTASEVFAEIKPDTPLSVLVFCMEADQNVLDVTFLAETPIEIDYH